MDNALQLLKKLYREYSSSWPLLFRSIKDYKYPVERVEKTCKLEWPKFTLFAIKFHFGE